MINVLFPVETNESFWHTKFCLTVQLIFQLKGEIIYYTFSFLFPDRDWASWM